MATIQSNDIILLLGAGASADAGIPTSAEMINRIEKNLKDNDDWREYLDLYNHIKSAIYYAAGLQGHFRQDVSYNIETLVNTLYELERNEEHPLYPFIASWNFRFVNLANPNFSNVKKFRRLILAELKKWMSPDDPSAGDYYSGFIDLQRDLNFPLRIFSLNYDLYVDRLEKHVREEFKVECGFKGYGPQSIWDWKRFDEKVHDLSPQIILYKLHGSIDWKRDESTKLPFSVEQIENVPADEMELVFGRDFKLEAADPYLFYIYEFRRYTLLAKLIVVVGYGFDDTHINKILSQGLQDDANRKILIVQPKSETSKNKAGIAQKLKLQEERHDQLISCEKTAKEFFEMSDLFEYLKRNVPEDNDDPF